MILQMEVLRGFPLYLKVAITGRRLRRPVKCTDVVILKIMKMKMMLTIIILRFINRVAFFPLLVCTSNTLDLLPCFKGEDYFEIPGADYMRRVGPVSQAGLVCWDLGTSVKHTKNQLHDYMEKPQPSRPGSNCCNAGILARQAENLPHNCNWWASPASQANTSLLLNFT